MKGFTVSQLTNSASSWLLAVLTALEVVRAQVNTDQPIIINQYGACADGSLESRVTKLEAQVAILTSAFGQFSYDLSTNNGDGSGTDTSDPTVYRDCHDVKQHIGVADHGVYRITPHNADPFDAYCNFAEDGDWLLVQRRVDGSVSFDRSWNEYKYGFGIKNINNNNWLGLEQLHALTNQRQMTMRFDITDWDGMTELAEYRLFQVGSEDDNYKITYQNFQGNAGDALGTFHQNALFSTFDKDNDASGSRNCAQELQSGWWFSECSRSNVNGLYYSQDDISSIRAESEMGVQWDTWSTGHSGNKWSFRATMMRIKPTYDN